MKKPSLILGKKQIILSCLTLMLAIAVYVNYALSDHDLTTAEKTPSEGVTYGDTAFVNAEAEGEKKTDAPEESDAAAATETAAEAESVVLPDPATADNAADYFAQARLERTASRGETVATLQSILGGGDQTEDELVTDAIAAVETSKLIESESTIESLIKSMGYQDCIVYLDGEGARVVVQSDGLDAAQAAAIKDVILGEVSVATENIRIFEVK